MTTIFKDQELRTFYKTCYAQSTAQNLPIGWLEVVFGDGNKTVESMRKYEETQEDFSYENFYRHMCAKSKRYVDILKKGVAFDVFKTCLIFQAYLHQMYLNAEKKYAGDITQYYKYLSSLCENEVTGEEWWFAKKC